jgi:hypothetical protein
MPGLADRFLACAGYTSQLTDKPVQPDRPSNLFSPVQRDYGAHGVFDARSKYESWHLRAATALKWPLLPDLIGGLVSGARMIFSAIRR